MIVVSGSEGRSCGCGQRGCLEAYCSAPAIVSSFSQIKNSGKTDVTCEKIFALARDGDETAVKVVSDCAKYLAIGVVSC